jgi:zinc/manganese transport system substrate-binding protein
MKRTRYSQACILLAALALPLAAIAKLEVVATTPDLASLASAIGGKDIDLTTLAKPTEDPHFVDAKPSFIVKLNRADLIIEGGAELEVGWLPALLDQSRNPKLAPGAPGHLAAARGLPLKEIPSSLDRSRGDIHAAGNPHFLVDPSNARVVADRIADTLSALDPQNASSYKARLKEFNTALAAKMAEWEARLAPYKGQEVAAYHNSWLYFGDHFGLKIDLFLEPKPGVPPTPSHLAEVIIKMKQEHVRAILVDPYLNRRTADTVAAKTGAQVVPVAQFPGGVPGTEGSYLQLIDHDVNAIANALGAK